eukprot:1158828-Pelagomonas_calceolata.AAC.7
MGRQWLTACTGEPSQTGGITAQETGGRCKPQQAEAQETKATNNARDSWKLKQCGQLESSKRDRWEAQQLKRQVRNDAAKDAGGKSTAKETGEKYSSKRDRREYTAQDKKVQAASNARGRWKLQASRDSSLRGRGKLKQRRRQVRHKQCKRLAKATSLNRQKLKRQHTHGKLGCGTQHVLANSTSHLDF